MKNRVNWIGLCTIVRREVWRFSDSPVQLFVAPWISALLFIFIFGSVVGANLPQIGGHRYLDFVLPGVLMMNIANAAFTQSGSTIYLQRFYRSVEEMLVSPLSYIEMIVGNLSVAVLRAAIVGAGILLMGLALGVLHIACWPMFLFWFVSVSTVFGLLGLLVGLWSKSFEQLSMPLVFILAPLSLAGGVFNTISMSPPWLRWLTYENPFFYFINGMRGAMIDFDESPSGFGVLFTLGLLFLLGTTTWQLFANGFGLRE